MEGDSNNNYMVLAQHHRISIESANTSIPSREFEMNIPKFNSGTDKTTEASFSQDKIILDICWETNVSVQLKLVWDLMPNRVPINSIHQTFNHQSYLWKLSCPLFPLSQSNILQSRCLEKGLSTCRSPLNQQVGQEERKVSQLEQFLPWGQQMVLTFLFIPFQTHEAIRQTPAWFFFTVRTRSLSAALLFPEKPKPKLC